MIVSPYYPPSNLAGVHRARHLAKHLPAHGWRPVIVRVDARFYEEAADPVLAALAGRETQQVRVSALPARLTRLAGVGDIGLRGYVPIRQAMEHLLRGRPPEAVMITGSPFYPMLLAGHIRRRFSGSVILDFQDPWASARASDGSRFGKSRLAGSIAAVLEPKAVRAADYITSVSEVQNEQMAARYGGLDASRMAAIPIGGDPEDFEHLRSGMTAPWPLTARKLHLSYVGACLPRATPLLQVLFQGLASLRQTQPALAGRLQVNFVGTSNQPGYRGEGPVSPIAAREGVADLVAETPERIGYLSALSVLANSHALLIIGSDEPHYTASKIYPAMMSGRPYLSLFHQASSAHAILSAAGGGEALAFASSSELAALRPTIEQALFRLASDPAAYGQADPVAYAPYTAHAVAGRFADLFSRPRRAGG